jgi:hypothetical protein
MDLQQDSTKATLSPALHVLWGPALRPDTQTTGHSTLAFRADGVAEQAFFLQQLQCQGDIVQLQGEAR